MGSPHPHDPAAYAIKSDNHDADFSRQLDRYNSTLALKLAQASAPANSRRMDPNAANEAFMQLMKGVPTSLWSEAVDYFHAVSDGKEATPPAGLDPQTVSKLDGIASQNPGLGRYQRTEADAWNKGFDERYAADRRNRQSVARKPEHYEAGNEQAAASQPLAGGADPLSSKQQHPQPRDGLSAYLAPTDRHPSTLQDQSRAIEQLRSALAGADPEQQFMARQFLDRYGSSPTGVALNAATGGLSDMLLDKVNQPGAVEFRRTLSAEISPYQDAAAKGLGYALPIGGAARLVRALAGARSAGPGQTSQAPETVSTEGLSRPGAISEHSGTIPGQAGPAAGSRSQRDNSLQEQMPPQSGGLRPTAETELSSTLPADPIALAPRNSTFSPSGRQRRDEQGRFKAREPDKPEPSLYRNPIARGRGPSGTGGNGAPATPGGMHQLDDTDAATLRALVEALARGA